jgi:hypothetical protein
MSQRYEPFRWSDPAIKERAEAERAAVQKRRAEAEAERAQRFEAELRARYLSAGGTGDQWEKEKSGVLAAARQAAALAGTDQARRANAERYG